MERVPRWVPRMGIVAAVIGLWAGLWLARPSDAPPEPAPTPTPLTGTVPLVAGTTRICPGGTYAGYGSVGLFVPPNYPGVPPTAPLTRCYDSLAQAKRAGLRLAGVPAGDAVVDGIYLVPAAPSVAKTCHRAARALGFTVPCPTLLPTPAFGTAPASCGTVGSFIVPTANNRNPPCVIDVGPYYQQPFRSAPPIRGFLLQEGGFAAPPEFGWTPAGNPSAAITVLAARPSVWRRVADATIGCEGSHVVGIATVLGAPAIIATCRSQFGQTAQTILRWERSGVAVSIAAVGSPGQNERLLEAIAAHLAFVER